MARKYEEQKITSKLNVLVETTCDICGAVAKRGDWESSCYEVNEVEVSVTVKQKDGSSYPDGGWGEELQADICPKCFKEKLIPFLRSEGCEIEEREWQNLHG